MSKQRTILMTSALPYANGEIHLGHLIETIQADIWARMQKLQGHRCLYICGSDAHGTGVMLAAEKRGLEAADWAAQVRENHMADFAKFHIAFDNFYTTHSDENNALSADIYQRLHARGDIAMREITQAFDPEANMFLADRFIRGECPKCGAVDQYGDNCEVCGATYNPTDLKNPVSAISGAKPIEKNSQHFFFCLDHYTEFLKDWINSGRLLPSVVNKLNEWLDAGLQQWDISRDAPYFGFEIPNQPGKYFYVWLDAPIGYMASLQDFCNRNPQYQFDDFWSINSEAELYHFIGKDIVNFHALFWPAMLHGASFRTPTEIFVHGFLTINGQKMSKSRGTFITGKQYCEQLEPEFLRYYFAAKLGPQVEDIDLNFADFMLRVNSDLVGKYVNLASRCAGFISKKFDGILATELHHPELFSEFAKSADFIADCFEKLNYNRAVREIMALADSANQYIDHHKPWTLAKEAGREAEVHAICTQGLNLFRQLTIFLKAILPVTAERVEQFLNIEPLRWSDLHNPLLNHKINKFKPLMQRVTAEQIDVFSEEVRQL